MIPWNCEVPGCRRFFTSANLILSIRISSVRFIRLVLTSIYLHFILFTGFEFCYSVQNRPFEFCYSVQNHPYEFCYTVHFTYICTEFQQLTKDDVFGEISILACVYGRLALRRV